MAWFSVEEEPNDAPNVVYLNFKLTIAEHENSALALI